MSKRGKSQAMLRRLRSRDDEDDDAEAEEENEPLNRLLDRLRSEYKQNFVGEMNLRPRDVSRARYLMEATAGNVGLASSLFWEDFLNENPPLYDPPPAAAAAAGSNAAAAAGEASVNASAAAAAAGRANSDAAAAGKRKSAELKESPANYEEMMAAIHAQNNPEGSAAPKVFAHHKKENNSDDDSDDDDDRKPSSNNDNNDWEEAVQRALAESRRLREEAQRNNPEQAVQRALAESQRLREQAERNNNEAAAAAARRGGFDRESSPRRDFNINPLDAPPPPIAGRRRLPQQELLDLDAFLQEVNRVAGGGGGAAAGFAALLPGAAGLQPEFQAPPAALPAERLARMQLQLLNPAAGGGDLLQFFNPLNGAPSARVSELLSRLFQGQHLNDEERRDLMAGLGIDNGQEFDYMSWLFRDANRGAAARGGAAAAGGAGGDDGDDSNNESDNDAAMDLDGPEQEGGAAPLRRSGRLRAQRNRRSRGRRGHGHDADGGALGRLGGVARFRRAAGRHHDGGAVSDDDDLFVPGPEPVFREIVASKVGPKIKTGKRKKSDDLNTKHLHGGEDDDSTSVVSDASSVDMTEFFHPIDKSDSPFAFLWGNTGGDSNDDSDDDERSYIPESWLRTGFSLSECGNGLAIAVPSDDEWEVVRRSHPQIIRDGPLKSIKGLFPYHCKGVSVLLSIVTSMIYSGASIRGNAVSCDADWTPFEDLSLEQRQREFPKRLIGALSALIFIAAQSTSARCAHALAQMDKHHNCRRKKHKCSPEDEDEFALNRLKMARRVRQCRVCSWEPDTANSDSPLFPHGRDHKDVRVHSSLTNIEDIKAYVRSHLRSFTEPGGCALFLETIARCHGTTYFKRLFESQTKTDKPSEDSDITLVGCKCKETLRYLEQKSNDKNLPGSIVDEHDCIRVELLSLLLTGQTHSNYEHWNADNLGIGLLRIDRETAIGPRLLRPVKPIWLCLGDFGYSTLMLDKTDFIGNVSSLDEPGKAFRLAHWDCWGGERTTMKVIPSIYDRPSKNELVPSVSDAEEDTKRTVAESIVNNMVQERKRETTNPWSSSSIYDASPKQLIKPITDEELQSIKFHPEDEKFYPREYKRWRFNVGGGTEWLSFFKLTGHQKLIVEMKLAPRICALVRTRWPLATVRDFVPEKKAPLV